MSACPRQTVTRTGEVHVNQSGRLIGRAPRLGGAREFRQLADALDHMLDDLRDRTRLREAMSAAVEIQQGLIPKDAPHVEGLDVHGFSAYCEETGGATTSTTSCSTRPARRSRTATPVLTRDYSWRSATWWATASAARC